MSSNTIVGLTNPSNCDDPVTKMSSNSFDADESVIIHKVEILNNLENIIEKIEKLEISFQELVKLAMILFYFIFFIFYSSNS